MNMLVLRLFCLSVLLPSTTAGWVSSTSTQKVMEIYSAGSQLYVGGDFLSQNSQHLGQQVAILNALTLAKSGKAHEAQKEIDLMAVSISLYDLPNTLRQGVSLVRSMLLEDPGALPKTINAGKKHIKVINRQLEIAVNDFSTKYPNPTPENLAEMRMKVNDILASDMVSKESRQSVLTALEQDFKRMEVLSTDKTNRLRKSRFSKIKTWYEHLKKNTAKKFLGNRVGDIGVLDPIIDFIGTALSINGLVIAAKNGDGKSIAINSIALVASVVGMITWFLAAGGVAFAGPVNVAVGLIAAVATLFINLFWPSNPTIDIANQFSKQAIQDLTANMEALKDPSYRSSFGWVFQANTGVFLIGSKIMPSNPITFRQPACTSETASSIRCDPKTKEFHGNNYLVAGNERKSSDSKYPLDVTSDFLGRPKTERFCGNTICLNAVSYYRTLNRKGTGVRFPHVRSLTIDTTSVPEYNKVDVNSFQPTSSDVQHNETSLIRDESKKLKAKKLSSKNERGKEKSKETVIKRSDLESAQGSAGCNPNRDRIEIDELRKFEPGSKKVYIRTGVGKDILSIGGLIGEPNDPRTNILDGNLGEAKGEANVFSVGYLLDTDSRRDDLIGGVKFNNTAAEGRVCYLKRDLVTWRCVGKVKGVNIFKGSRFHDTVILGGHGPRTVIQHYGANEYNFRIDDVKSVLDGRDAATDMCPEHGEWAWGHYRVGDEDYCYALIQTLKSTFEEAQAVCNELGAGLVTIHSGAENSFVASFLENVGQGRWLGLTTNYKKGSYRWLDGSEMGEPPYLNFRESGRYTDPITSVRGCILMLTEGEWMYSSCLNTHSFACKKPTTGANSCGNQWSSHNVLGHLYCYKAFGVTDESQRKSFSGAVSHCKSQGASLTSIMNEDEQTFLLGLNREVQWIGLDDGWGYRKFYWSDGQRLDSGGTKWTAGEPNNENYQEHCVLLEGTEWKDWNCEEKKRFTCEKKPGNSQGSLQCPDNWNLHGSSCLLGVSSAKTWPEAEVYCKEQHAVLVKADSDAKISAVSSIQGLEASWIGLRDDKYNLKYRWFDGSDLDYSNWDSEKPFHYSRMHCAIMKHGSGGKWIPYYCKDDLWRNPFCKKKAIARMNYEITDISKDGRPLVKVFIPDSMPRATVKYDPNSMVIHVKDPSLGWVARIVFIRDLPFGPHVYQVKYGQETRVAHTALE